MIYLKGNTASQEVPLGYFLDSTDGNTEETALSIANTDIKIWKSGATTLANKNSGGATHISNGIYYAVLDATDTNTYGPLVIFVHVAGALACKVDCNVLAEPVYDSLFPSASGNPLPVFGIIDWGTAQASAAGTLVHRSGLNLANDLVNGSTEFIYAGTGAGQSRVIHDFVNSTDTASISPNWTTTPSTDSQYVTAASPPAPTDTSVLPAVNLTAWNGTSVATPDTAGYPKVTIKDGTGAGEIALTSGAIDTVAAVTTVNGLAANVITAAATAADFTTEIQSGLATAAALATVDDFLDTEVAAILAAVDTEVAAIKAKTDQLTFTKTNELDANVQSINGATVTGDGNATSWDGA